MTTLPPSAASPHIHAHTPGVRRESCRRARPHQAPKARVSVIQGPSDLSPLEPPSIRGLIVRHNINRHDTCPSPGRGPPPRASTQAPPPHRAMRRRARTGWCQGHGHSRRDTGRMPATHRGGHQSTIAGGRRAARGSLWRPIAALLARTPITHTDAPHALAGRQGSSPAQPRSLGSPTARHHGVEPVAGGWHA